MSWSWTRAAAAAAWLGVLVTGVLLLAGGRGSEAPHLAWRTIFLPACAVLLISTAGILRAGRARPLAVVALVSAATLFAAGWFARAPGPGATGAEPATSNAVPVAAGHLRQVLADLEVRGEREAATLPDPLGDGAHGGALFRTLASIPGRWARSGHAAGLPLEAAVWADGERVAWTSQMRPLPVPVPTPESAASSLTWFRDRWVLRRLTPGPAGRILELQVALPIAGAAGGPGGVWREVAVTVVPADAPDAPASVAAVPLDGDRSSPRMQVSALGDVASTGRQAARARLHAVLLIAWAVLLVVLSRVTMPGSLWLVAAWLARAFLASSDLRRWVVASLPSVAYPTAPGSWLSLVDPAYFATPVLQGWFASTADALLTAALATLTVIAVWRRRTGALPQERPDRAVSPARVWLGAIAFAGLGAAVLLLLRGLVFLLATNANPRLIGPGVALSHLSFWGLHLVLLLLSLAGLALLVLAAGRLRPVTGRSAAISALTIGFATGGAVVIATGCGPLAGALAAALAVALWFGPGLALRSPVAFGRFVWPALVLAAAVWNYTSLARVHDIAERAWLERRAGALTEADAGWMRYLLQSVLEQMQQDDDVSVPLPASALWRDEAAWRLYQDSALRDLNYPCLVEVMDEREQTSSLFAAGFLRDFRYETVTRSAWTGSDAPLAQGGGVLFQDERRLYSGGQEDILVAEAPRRSGRGWLRVEVPLRSWRVSTLLQRFDGDDEIGARYRPRAEVDRPILMMLADDQGWLGSGPEGFPGPAADPAIADLRAGTRVWTEIAVGDARWLCRWSALPPQAARSPGEGFVLGIRRAAPGETVLDFSRFVLVNLAAFFLMWSLVQSARRRPRRGHRDWQPGFQEKFLAGYLALGLLLLLVVGLSVDRVGYQRVRAEARQQARDGLTMAVQQLVALLSDQARSLAESDDLAALLRNPGDRDARLDLGGSRQAVLFGDDGAVKLDLSQRPLTDGEATMILAAARSAPMVVFADADGLWAGVGIPVELGGAEPGGASPAAVGADDASSGHSDNVARGLFFYRLKLESALVNGLADILHGELTLSVDGAPQFASHPEGLFAGRRPQLLDPGLMAALFDHPQGPGLASPPGRPFACDAAQPLPALAVGEDGHLARRTVPAVLGVSFPGRERDFAAQRRAMVLFLAGLANLILLTALLLAALMSWNLFRPLRVLSRATRSLAEGDYAAPLPPVGGDEVGQLAAAFGAMRSQVQAARDDLAARQKFLATVLERVTVGVAVLTRSGDLVVLNPAGRTILSRFWPGTSTAEAAARLRGGLGGRMLDSAATAVPAWSRGPVASRELVGDGGRLTLRGALAPLDDAAADGDQMIVFEDISEFLATKKLALNAELARQVAHEIKNPLTPIQLSVQLLGQAWKDRHPQLERIVPETVARVLDQVDLLRRIASEFSLLGRPDDLPLGPVDLPALVRRVAGTYAGGAGQATEGPLRAGPAPAGLPPALAHEESLLKILGNLMQNSLDAVRPGQPPVIEASWESGAGRVRLRWRDNGAGLPADVADRLFEPYFSTKSKGTGLGLAICRSLAERMGGSITLADRTDGPGAEAVLDLAAAPEGNGDA